MRATISSSPAEKPIMSLIGSIARSGDSEKLGLAFHQYSAAEQKEFLPIVFCYSSKMHVPLSRSFCAAFLAISSFSGAQDTKPADIEARVYVYRYEQLYGKAIRPSLYCD